MTTKRDTGLHLLLNTFISVCLVYQRYRSRAKSEGKLIIKSMAMQDQDKLVQPCSEGL